MTKCASPGCTQWAIARFPGSYTGLCLSHLFWWRKNVYPPDVPALSPRDSVEPETPIRPPVKERSVREVRATKPPVPDVPVVPAESEQPASTAPRYRTEDAPWPELVAAEMDRLEKLA